MSVKPIPPKQPPAAELRPSQPAARRKPADPARRNADAYTGFVVMSALSTALFLTGAGLTVRGALRYGRAAGKEALLRGAAQQSDRLFDRGGRLNADAQEYSEGMPGLYGLLQSLERRAEQEDGDIQLTLQKMKAEARAERREEQAFLRDAGIAAGCGLVGMLVFISAAKITRHRGLMLFGPARPRRVQASLRPNFAPGHFGAGLTLRW